MKPNYKSWMPKGMVIGFFAATAVEGTGLLLGSALLVGKK